MPQSEKHIGIIYSISSSSAIAFMDDSVVSMERTLGGKTYRIGQIGTFVAIPVGTTSVIGMIARLQLSRQTQSAGSSQSEMADIVKAKKEMEIQLVGSVLNGRFEKGIASFPPIRDHVFMTDDSDITSLFSTFAQFGFAIGDISGYLGERQYIDPNKFFGKHVALLGSTGSGKSTAVASISPKSSDVFQYTRHHPRHPRRI